LTFSKRNGFMCLEFYHSKQARSYRTENFNIGLEFGAHLPKVIDKDVLFLAFMKLFLVLEVELGSLGDKNTVFLIQIKLIKDVFMLLLEWSKGHVKTAALASTDGMVAK
jgi:hypothetical protein